MNKILVLLVSFMVLLILYGSAHASSGPGYSVTYVEGSYIVFEYPTYNGVRINEDEATPVQWASELGYVLDHVEYECLDPDCKGWGLDETYGYNYGSWEIHTCDYNDFTWDNCYLWTKRIFVTEFVIEPGDDDRGHGNDPNGYDPDNPGKGCDNKSDKGNKKRCPPEGPPPSGGA